VPIVLKSVSLKPSGPVMGLLYLTSVVLIGTVQLCRGSSNIAREVSQQIEINLFVEKNVF
jgi:hypothetical protein